MKRDLESEGKRRKSFIIIFLVIFAIIYSFYSPNYKEKDWLALFELPAQQIGETDAEYYFNTTIYIVLFPLKALRAAFILETFKINYSMFSDKGQNLTPLRHGAYVLQLSMNEEPISLVVPLSRSKLLFDLGNDYKTRISWVNKHGAVLFIDKNKNNILDDYTELMRVNDVTLWDSLKAYDENGDQILDGRDKYFKDFKLLWDKDNNQIFAPNEVFNFSSFVQSIKLENRILSNRSSKLDMKVAHWKGDSILLDRVTHFSSSIPVWINKKDMRKDLHIMYFDEDKDPNNTDPFTYYNKNNKYNYLPNLRGYGELLDLRATMRNDGELRLLVEGFIKRDADSILFNLARTDFDVTNILLSWAEVDGVNPDGRGWFIDGRKLGYLEKLDGKRFAQLEVFFDPMPYAANKLKYAWDKAFFRQRALLILQSSVGKKMFGDDFVFEYVSEKVISKSGVSPDYLDRLIYKAQDLSIKERRKLLQVIIDIFDVYIVIYTRDSPNKIKTITKKEALFRDKQLALLLDFRKKLFP